MYLTRTAGIETKIEVMVIGVGCPMYLTRTAGIETARFAD